MIWLGSKRGYLTDWVTQRWVQLTGRRVDLTSDSWLAGPIASTTGIGPDYFAWLARTEGLRLGQPDRPTGVVSGFTNASWRVIRPD
jgi:hypothetical protein